MKAEHIRSLQIAVPFQPFKLMMADGSSYTVRHPELILVTETLLAIASPVEDPTTSVPTKAVLCAPEHVTVAEVVGRSSLAN